MLEDVSEGPGTEILLEAFSRLQSGGQLSIDRDRLGLDDIELDHIETLLGLLATAELHAKGSVQLNGRPLSFCLFSAHVAASLMEDNPAPLQKTPLENVPEEVLGADAAQLLYDGLHDAPLRLRCRFGLSFVGLASLVEHLAKRNLVLAPPDLSAAAQTDKRADWLKEALARAEEDELLLAGLADYLSGFDEVDEVAEEEPLEEE